MTTPDILAPEIFDCEKTYRSFCEVIGCEGGHKLIECLFNQWYGKEIFYFVSRKELEKWLSCKVNENRKICGFKKNARLAHGLSILECALMMLIILNHVRMHLSSQFAGKFIFQLYILLKLLKLRLQELEREQQLTGTKNDFLVLVF